MKTTLDNWRRYLNENQANGTKVNRRKTTEDPPSVKKRKQPWEVFPGYDDAWETLSGMKTDTMQAPTIMPS